MDILTAMGNGLPYVAINDHKPQRYPPPPSLSPLRVQGRTCHLTWSLLAGARASRGAETAPGDVHITWFCSWGNKFGYGILETFIECYGMLWNSSPSHRYLEVLPQSALDVKFDWLEAQRPTLRHCDPRLLSLQ